MKLPNYDELLNLHQDLSNSRKSFVIVWKHCNIVRDLSLQIADNLKKKGIKVDRDLLEVGALIHDIGAYSCFDTKQEPIKPYIQHGILGEQVLLDQGLPMELARFASHHTGVGITKKDIEQQNLPLPKKDFIPETLEEEIVCFADKFHSKSSNFHGFEEIVTDLSQYGPDKVKRLKKFKEKFGIPELPK